MALALCLCTVLAACGAGAGPGAGGPGAAGPAPGLRSHQLTSGGQERSYLLYSPPGLDRRRQVPLFVVLGGVGDTPANMVQVTELDPLASSDGILVAYPQGLYGSSWNAGFCCAGALEHKVDDLGFLVSLIRRLEATYPVDPSAVYVSGVSDGAMMAYRLACEDPGLVSGVGSVAGAMVLDSCHPDRPVSVIEIHGTADPLVPFQGGPIQPAGAMASAPAPSSPALAADWASLDGCQASPAVARSGPVTTSTWTGCRGRASVRLVAVAGGGHTWFAPGFGPVDGAVDSTAAMLGFLTHLGPSS